MFPSSIIRDGFIAGCVALTLNVAAAEDATDRPNAAMRYAAISTQRDDNHNHETTGTLSLTFGDHVWAHAGLGKIHAQQGDGTIDPTLISIGAGVVGRQLMFTLDFSQRKDGDRYDQRDWNSSLDWHNDKFGFGIDGLHRDIDAQAVVAIANGQSLTDVPVAESLRGHGIGLHARFNPVERLTVSLAGMHYHYDTQIRQNGTASNGSNSLIGSLLNNQPLVTQQLLMQASGITRDDAILQRSWNAGVGYRWDRVALSAQYFNDKALDDGTVNTVEFGAAFFLDKHWTLSPTIGRSHSEQLSGVTFGSLTASYGW